jgi:hypothetical protein
MVRKAKMEMYKVKEKRQNIRAVRLYDKCKKVIEDWNRMIREAHMEGKKPI